MVGPIGIIGGSGIYELPGLKNIEEIKIETPFGQPSDVFIKGKLQGKDLVFLSRHGRGHRIPPSSINYRANIYGMKKLGVRWLISVSAVGSMKEEIRPGDFVFPDQFIDLTKKRSQSFFDDGIVAHVGMADPTCPILSKVLFDAAKSLEIPVHYKGTYVCIEGPQFSTRAESHLYRQWGVDVIGMTNMPEVRLAREAEISYCTMALATDYDCWRGSEEEVDINSVLEIISKNIANAKKVLTLAVENLNFEGKRTCDEALKNAIITDPKTISEKTRRNLELLIGPYLT